MASHWSEMVMAASAVGGSLYFSELKLATQSISILLSCLEQF